LLVYEPSFQLNIACVSSRHARRQGCWRRRSRMSATNREERAMGKKTSDKGLPDLLSELM
jgi:hypothetical protein